MEQREQVGRKGSFPNARHWSCNTLFVESGRPSFVGRGSFGHVVKAYRKHFGTVAVKITSATNMQEIEKFKREADMHVNAQTCKHIINIMAWIADYDLGIVGFVMDYAENGTVHGLLHTWDGEIPLELKKRFVFEFASGLDFLHNVNTDQRILHLDLKPFNLLLDVDLHVKICDFGGSVLSTITADWSHARQLEGSVATMVYCSPERLQSPNMHPDSKVDVYSFGVSVWQILAREKPLQRVLTQQLRSFVVDQRGRPEIYPRMRNESDALCSLVEQCWEHEPQRRPSANGIVTILECNCPIDYKQVARQVSNIIQSLENSPPLTEETAQTPLLSMFGTNQGHPYYFPPNEGQFQPPPIVYQPPVRTHTQGESPAAQNRNSTARSRARMTSTNSSTTRNSPVLPCNNAPTQSDTFSGDEEPGPSNRQPNRLRNILRTGKGLLHTAKNTLPPPAAKLFHSSFLNNYPLNPSIAHSTTKRIVIIGDSGKSDVITVLNTLDKNRQVVYNVEKGAKALRDGCNLIILSFSQDQPEDFKKLETKWMKRVNSSKSSKSPKLLIMLVKQIAGRRTGTRSLHNKSELEQLGRKITAHCFVLRENQQDDQDSLLTLVRELTQNRR